MRKEKVSLLVGSRWGRFALYALLSLCAVVSTFYAVLVWRAGMPSPYAIALSVSLSVALLVFFITFLRRERRDAGFVFLLVATPALFGFCFFVLPDQVPDEIWHIYRVLNFTGSGNGGMVVPDALTYHQTPLNYKELYYALVTAPDWGSTHVVERDMSSYLSHLYAVPGVFAALGKAMNLNPFVVVYMGRMANLALFLVVAYWILRLLPLGKTVAFVYLLNPILLQQEASCSADAFLNAAALLFVAYFIKLVFSDRVDRRQWAILCVLLLLTCISKYAYAPLATLLLLLVPKMSSRRQTRIAIYVSASAVFLLAAAYALFAYQGPAFKDALDLVRSPGEMASVLIRSLFVVGPFWLSSFGGVKLGALNVSVWDPCLWAYFVLLAVSVLYNLGEKLSLDRKKKLFLSILIFIMVVFIILAFREWSLAVEKRSDVIIGVQGRYFIPLFLLPLLCFVGPKSAIRRPNCLYGYSAVMVFIFVVDFASIVRFFW